MNVTSDSLLAQELQKEFDCELVAEQPAKHDLQTSKGLIDPTWEVLDPTPDIYALFISFDDKFFWGRLRSVCVSWSNRMTRCAGICTYHGRGGMCEIKLSAPLLKLRPRKDLIETLLHEMIHAFLFVTHNNRDRDGHGPEFHKHMYRINSQAGTKISVYHDFHAEVREYLVHWWRCNGPCQNRKPFFGYVRRSMNRAPGPNDRWWQDHLATCGGTFIKIKSPDPKVTKKGKENKPLGNIRNYIQSPNLTNQKQNDKSTLETNSKFHTVNNPSTSQRVTVTIPSKTNNIFGFSSHLGNNNVKGTIKNSSSTVVITKKPLSNTSLTNQKASDTDYEVVRKHWLNRFEATETGKGCKRSQVTVEQSVKIPRIMSTSSLAVESTICPVCEKSIAIADLNKHLDQCLTNPEITKECIICCAKVNKSAYEKHVSECVQKNFDNDDDDDVVFVDSPGNGSVHNGNRCPHCQNVINSKKYAAHIAYCTNRKQVEILDQPNEKIDCLACGEKIEKSYLNIHLDQCLSTVFDDEKISEDTKEVDDDVVCCPFCMKLLPEAEMKNHVSNCFETMGDYEAELNKTLLLKELD